MKTLSVILLMVATCGIPTTAQNGNTAEKSLACDTLKTKATDKEAKAEACRRIFMDKGMARRDTTLRMRMDRKAFTFRKYDSFSEKMKEPWLGGLLKDVLFR